ncbi:MAG: rod shape-determining protein MreC [Lentisphaerae bacterium]|nr:rod shape-determining protein MreC [Lentisphaerota bacterium]
MARGTRAWVTALLLTLVLLMIGGTRVWMHRLAREGVYPLENGAAWIRTRIWGQIVRLWTADGLARRNRALEAEVERLRLDAAMLERIAVENRELRRQLDLKPRVPGRLVPCMVLSAGGSSGWWRQIRISRGRSDGLSVGDPVLTADGLVGRITDLTASTAEVRLITDRNSRIACQLDPVDPETGVVRGILHGADWNAGSDALPEMLHVIEPMRLRYLERDVELPPRTRVVTSGLGGTLPAGLLVGYLLDSEVDANGLYCMGDVMPAVDFASLTLVYAMAAGGGAP